MATGAGKSLCFQIPSLVSGHITLVVSPLISLMQDQVFSLRRMGIRAALAQAGAVDLGELKEAQLIYITPEKLVNFSQELKMLHKDVGVCVARDI